MRRDRTQSIEPGTMFSAQASTGLPLVTRMPTAPPNPAGGAERAGSGEGRGGVANQETLTEVAGLCSVQKNWLMNKN